jgi:hypothetical protein
VAVADDSVKYVDPAVLVVKYKAEAVLEFKYVAVADESVRYVELAVVVVRYTVEAVVVLI